MADSILTNFFRENRLTPILMFLILPIILTGCSTHSTYEPNDENVVLIDDRVTQTWNIRNLYDSENFHDTSNISAEPLQTTKGNKVIVAQIRDRESFHLHREHDLIVHLLEGEGKLRSRHRATKVQTGDWLIIPRSVPHQFINTGTKPARALVIRTPPPAGKDYVEKPEGSEQ